MPEPNIPFVDLPHEYAHPPLQEAITDERAWTLETLDPKDTLVHINEAQMSELRKMAQDIRDNPLPDLVRAVDQSDAPDLYAAMGEISALLSGPGFGTLNRLPVDEFGVDLARTIYWILGQMIARPVAQRWDGTMVFDVTDTGTAKGAGVRDSMTNAELLFHTDNGFNVTLPDTVSLFCINKGREGGISRFASIYSLHNRMLERYPGQLSRLYRPVLFDRKREHAQGEPTVLRAPVFQWDGDRLTARPNAVYVRQGYDLAGLEPDQELNDALDALIEVAGDLDLWVETLMERGQLQYLNNRRVVHYRSAFVDYDEPERKRCMSRIWYREDGRPTYNG
jgi:alpha-ketoglutarate-dependent taurine dioxygenase